MKTLESGYFLTADLDNDIKNIEVKVIKKYSKQTQKTQEYINIPMAFDIETTSFRENGKKRGTMYVWQMGVDKLIFTGRTWAEWENALKIIAEHFGLNENRKAIIYVQNLGFEFEWIKNRLSWVDVQATDTRKPYKAESTLFIFRDSQILSARSLAKIGEGLTKHNIKKRVGDLDYNLMRHSKTPLTAKEMDYAIGDIEVLLAYIEEQMEMYGGSLLQIPATNTGRVRSYCKQETLYIKGKDGKKRLDHIYRGYIDSLTIEPAEYEVLRKAYMGGFTHASMLWANSPEPLENITSYDETSAYPAMLTSKFYPVDKGVFEGMITEEQLRELVKDRCCAFKAVFKNLRSKILHEHYASSSKHFVSRERLIKDINNMTLDNGRIVYADSFETYLTDDDFWIFDHCYQWDSLEISECWSYARGRLPKALIKSILKLYEDKTALKDVEGKKAEYQVLKEMLNSVYGMCCQAVSKDEITFDGEWDVKKEDKNSLTSTLDKYNTDKKRFLYYPWGVWTSSANRRRLWECILDIGTDYVYTDTDSIKLRNGDKWVDYFNKKNEEIRAEMYAAMDFYKLPRELVEPKNKNGVKKLLGAWDNEGTYDRAKFCGRKRYMVEKDGEYEITIAGLNKVEGGKYLASLEDPFAYFDDGMTIPAKNTGKAMPYYPQPAEEHIKGRLVDYLGNEAEYEELSWVNLEPAPFEMNELGEFVALCKYIRANPDCDILTEDARNKIKENARKHDENKKAKKKAEKEAKRNGGSKN